MTTVIVTPCVPYSWCGTCSSRFADLCDDRTGTSADTSGGSSTPVGAIVGGVVGGVVFLALALVALWWCCNKDRRDKKRRKNRPYSAGYFGDKYTAYDEDAPYPSSVRNGSIRSSSFGDGPAAGMVGVGGAALASRPTQHYRNASSSSRRPSNAPPSQPRRVSSRRVPVPNAGSEATSAGMAGVGAGALRKPHMAAATPPGLGRPIATQRGTGRMSLGSDAGDAARRANTAAPATGFGGAGSLLNPPDANNPIRDRNGDYDGMAAAARLSRMPSNAPTARSVPRLGPVDANGDTRSAHRGGLRVMNEEPEEQQDWGDRRESIQNTGAYGINGVGTAAPTHQQSSYRRDTYDANAMRPMSDTASMFSFAPSFAGRRGRSLGRGQSLTASALEARDRREGSGDPDADEAEVRSARTQGWRSWGGIGSILHSRGPPSYHTNL